MAYVAKRRTRGPNKPKVTAGPDGDTVTAPIIATAADGGVCNVGTWTGPLGVGIGEVAVVAATDLQQVFIHVLGG